MGILVKGTLVCSEDCEKAVEKRIKEMQRG